MMKLYGSTTSPYVRRLRLLLADTEHEFVLQQITGEDREKLRKLNPTMKVPMLVDGDLCLFDSRVIYRYIAEQQGLASLSWHQENLMTLVDAANDSLVQRFILGRSGVAPDSDLMYIGMQNERIGLCLQELEKAVAAGDFGDWEYLEICLFCLLAWIEFRNLWDLQDFPNLLEFYRRHADKPEVLATVAE